MENDILGTMLTIPYTQLFVFLEGETHYDQSNPSKSHYRPMNWHKLKSDTYPIVIQLFTVRLKL